jgi:TRAP-type C4-dicarboxylate transport system substrate-binding protein
MAIALVAAPLGLASAHAAETEWKMHVVWVATRPEAKEAAAWADRVNARTTGKLKIVVHAGGSLGAKDADMLRLLPSGRAIQATMLYPGYVARDAPELAFLLPEGVLASPTDVVKLMPHMSGVYERIFSRWEVKYLATFLSPEQVLGVFCKNPVATLDALRKVKLRVWNKALIETFSKLGVASSVIPQNDMYMAMQTGVVDCALYSAGSANTLSLHEVAPNWSYLGVSVLPINLIVSQKAWQALPADVQAVLQEEATRMQAELLKDFTGGQYSAAEEQRFQAAGGKRLADFPVAEQRAFNASAREVWEETSRGLGDAAVKNKAELSKALQE